MTGTFETRDKIEEKVIKMYSYGSSVYGTETEKSDFDFIVVVESKDKYTYSVSKDGADYTVYTEPLFREMIQEHYVHILECIFQSLDDSYLTYFELDLEKLRRQYSGVTSNSYVKCKKKIRDGEEYIGLKSMFHSIRLLEFAIQIAKHGRIVDYSSANRYLGTIMTIGADWDTLDSIFRPIYNSLKSELRLLAPLEKDKEKL